MYALIEDEHDLTKRKKSVLSIHDSREAAEQALEEHRKLFDPHEKALADLPQRAR